MDRHAWVTSNDHHNPQLKIVSNKLVATNEISMSVILKRIFFAKDLRRCWGLNRSR